MTDVDCMNVLFMQLVVSQTHLSIRDGNQIKLKTSETFHAPSHINFFLFDILCEIWFQKAQGVARTKEFMSDE